jgi:predicted MFS family arabinose efflux permease
VSAMATSMTSRGVSAWHATLAGLCATLVGIGLARFAYTPLIPPLITEGWFSAADAAYLGAANLVGYLAGALAGQRLTARLTPRAALRALMLLAAASFFAGAYPLSYAWFFAWRFISGFAGGALMVLAAPSVLPLVPPARRGRASGVIFTGVGLGIAASGTLVPLLLQVGLRETWWALGLLSLLLTALAWPAWPDARAAEVARGHTGRASGRSALPLRALYLEYGLNAFGLVPHMVFLVDFIARGLGHGLASGARDWVLFGIGAMLGPLLAGRAADRIGFRATLRLSFLIQMLAIMVPAVTGSAVGLAVSSLVVGAFVPGVVPLAFGRARELAAGDEARSAWSVCTAAFAVGQASGAYALSYVFAIGGGNYVLLFATGAAALALALAIDLAVTAVSTKGNVR